MTLTNIKDGANHIVEWLGAGGRVVSRQQAQRRADICLACARNRPGSPLTKPVALAVKLHLGIKNKLNLRVKGEKSLHACQVCQCQLRLQIWQEQELVESQLTDEEIAQLPTFCWKNP